MKPWARTQAACAQSIYLESEGGIVHGNPAEVNARRGRLGAVPGLQNTEARSTTFARRLTALRFRSRRISPDFSFVEQKSIFLSQRSLD
jgi:hypothetical protein